MLPINEIFETIQGEGVYTGVPAIFIRLQGCPVGCPWCDTKHTWEVEEKNQIDAAQVLVKTEEAATYFNLEERRILTIFSEQGYSAKHVVITGGEPCLYNLTALTDTLHTAGYSTQIETSGTFEILCNSDTWVTVSPKVDMQGGFAVLTSAIERANEVKHPVAMQKHIDELDCLLAKRKSVLQHVCLQPISQRPRATELAIQTCIQRNWRLSLQMHKYVGIE